MLTRRVLERGLLLFVVLLLVLSITRSPTTTYRSRVYNTPSPAATAAPPRPPQSPAPAEPRPDLDPAVEAEVRGAAVVDRDVAAHPAPGARVTAVLMSYPASRRHHRLEQILRAALSDAWRPYVASVVLVWNGDLALLPPAIHAALLQAAGPAADEAIVRRDGPVRDARRYGRRALLLGMHANRVDNRWRVAPYIPTPAALNIDDDIDLLPDGVRCLVDTWRAMRPLTVVSIDVRAYVRHPDGRGPFGEYGYAARDTTGGVKRYSLALPRTLITHRHHMERYDALWRDNATHVRAVVDELLCDDIAFNFVVANGTGATGGGGGGGGGSVVYVKANYRPFSESQGRTAMFNKPGMKAMRQQCVNRLADAFGGVPLTSRQWHVMCTVDG